MTHHIALEDITLAKGSHKGSKDGPYCVMEWVSIFADERKPGSQTDSPRCTSRVLTNFAIAWNDALDDETRQRLVPFIPRLVGTSGNRKADNLRAWMATDWLARTYAPAMLRLTPSLVEHADTLAALDELTNATTAADSAALSAALSAADSAALSAADSAALSVARSVARSAARSAALSAALSVARSAARSAALSAALSAARSVALSAADSAALSAADSALGPTVKELQESAFALFDRMIDAGGAA